jgi:hypothetical protein
VPDPNPFFLSIFITVYPDRFAVSASTNLFMMKKQIIRSRFLYFKAWPQIYMVFKKTRRSNKEFFHKQANSEQRILFTFLPGKDNANKIDLTPIWDPNLVSKNESGLYHQYQTLYRFFFGPSSGFLLA